MNILAKKNFISNQRERFGYYGLIYFDKFVNKSCIIFFCVLNSELQIKRIREKYNNNNNTKALILKDWGWLTHFTLRVFIPWGGAFELRLKSKNFFTKSGLVLIWLMKGATFVFVSIPTFLLGYLLLCIIGNPIYYQWELYNKCSSLGSAFILYKVLVFHIVV